MSVLKDFAHGMVYVTLALGAYALTKVQELAARL